jgi:hypothetical protein
MPLLIRILISVSTPGTSSYFKIVPYLGEWGAPISTVSAVAIMLVVVCGIPGVEVQLKVILAKGLRSRYEKSRTRKLSFSVQI